MSSGRNKLLRACCYQAVDKLLRPDDIKSLHNTSVFYKTNNILLSFSGNRLSSLYPDGKNILLNTVQSQVDPCNNAFKGGQTGKHSRKHN